MQRTLVLLKPDAVQRALAGEIIARIERKGLKIAGMKLMLIAEDLAREHYGEHVGKPFFEGPGRVHHVEPGRGHGRRGRERG